MLTTLPFLAEAGQALPGGPWLSLLTLCIALATLVLSIISLRRPPAPAPVAAPVPVALAAPPPPAPVAAPVRAVAAVAPVPAGIAPETMAIIAACVALTYGKRARIASIRPADLLLQQWSVEGRRQIYSSHQVR
jgi:hypothetical protein